MKQPRGAISRTVGAVASSVADAARRRQGDREPRVVVYDEAGHATLLRSDTPEHDALVETAERIVGLVAGPPEGAEPAPDDLETPPGGGEAGEQHPPGEA